MAKLENAFVEELEAALDELRPAIQAALDEIDPPRIYGYLCPSV